MIILYVPKDGNCMFSCLASFFNKSDIDHVLLRQMIVRCFTTYSLKLMLLRYITFYITKASLKWM